MNEDKRKDMMYGLFAGMSNESLPEGFNEKVMLKVRKEAKQRKMRYRYLNILGYISGAIAVIALCLFALRYTGVSFPVNEYRDFVSFVSPFQMDMFNSPSFLFSLYIGGLALILLITDLMIRRHMEKA